MKSVDLAAALDKIPTDAEARAALCRAFRVIRDFLQKNVASKGVAGVIFRALFPQTAETIAQLVAHLDAFIAANCGQ